MPTSFSALANVHRCPGCQSAWINAQPEASKGKAIEAVRLFNDAWEVLAHFIEHGFRAHSLVRLVDANADGDDVLLACCERIPLLRQQHERASEPCLCLSDFVRPLSTGRTDKIGLFVSSCDVAMEECFPNDPYRHMLAQTLADRLAEAAIEKTHQYVRTTLWGYAPEERLSPQELFSEKYQGIRPAVGYPSLPDQSLNFILDKLLGFQQVGVSLTESGAMRPHASVSGLMLSHPAARYFTVGTIGKDQFLDYAIRRGMDAEELARYLTM